LPTPAQAAKLGAIRAERARRQAELDELAKAKAPDPARRKSLEDQVAALKKREEEIQPATTMVMQELPQPRETHVLMRGSHNVKGDRVSPGVPSVLHGLASDRPPDRLALARWLVDPRNPLVGRVILNRIWAQYFGRGIVETSEDFGVQGEPPSHPELLA